MHVISRLIATEDDAAIAMHRAVHAFARTSATRSGYITAIVRDLADVENLWRILDLSGEATYFQSFAFFASWVQNIAPAYGADWFVIAVLDRISLLPVMLLPLALVRSGYLRIIEAADLGVCDFNAPMVDRRFTPSSAQMAQIWTDAVAVMPRADLIRITKMPDTIGDTPNPLLKLGVAQKIKLANFKTPLTQNGKVWSLDDLPEKFRLDLAARRRKLSKRGKLEFRVAESDTEADRYFAALLQQRGDRFRALGRADVMDCPAHRRFYRSLIEPASAESPASIQALLIDGDPIATGYGLQSPDSFGMIFPTFKADGWRNYSPGLQLFIESMTWAARSGLAYYDFTIGGESFKLDLGAQESPLYEHLQPLTLKARPLVYREHLRNTVGAHPRLKSIIEHAVPRNIHASWRLAHAQQR